MSYDKFMFDLIESTQIMFGPCKRKGSEYQRVNRMVKAGNIDSIADGERRYISRKFFVEFVGSAKLLDERLEHLYSQGLLKKLVYSADLIKIKKVNENQQNNLNNLNNVSETNNYNKANPELNLTKIRKKSHKECQINWLKEAFNLRSPLHKDLADFMGVRPETISKYMTNKESFIKLKIEKANMVFEFFGFGNYHQLWETGTITPPSSISNLNKNSNPIKMNLTQNKPISKELDLKIKDVKKSISTELDVNIDDVVINIDIPAKKLNL
jgi:hypothetical protein